MRNYKVSGKKMRPRDGHAAMLGLNNRDAKRHAAREFAAYSGYYDDYPYMRRIARIERTTPARLLRPVKRFMEADKPLRANRTQQRLLATYMRLANIEEMIAIDEQLLSYAL